MKNLKQKELGILKRRFNAFLSKMSPGDRSSWVNRPGKFEKVLTSALTKVADPFKPIGKVQFGGENIPDPENWLKSCEDAQIFFDSIAEEVLFHNKTSGFFSLKRAEFEVVMISAEEVGLGGGATRRDISSVAKDFSLTFFPTAEVIKEIVLRCEKKIPKSETIFLDMKPLLDKEEGHRFILSLRHDGSRWIVSVANGNGPLFIKGSQLWFFAKSRS